ncbi:hypothetical protein [Staphylococcus phage Stab21]|uniref:Uncharacterized protein n=4 Tax=Kayvirus TaxID=1857843 RepID=V5XWS0_BPS25|nr:hypothetical protein X600_gp043 [Staphylococcus phage S25-3]YP_009006824.1 hypothetical protein CF75_gp153 [Staphylococcus phage phiSA12]ARM69006.1 hypothetical protein vBSauCG_89 [Staphylococcus phage vB_Sau_CG]QKE56226.1 hypothetical protein METROID_177 [Staphylococcus phage Metroid]WLY87039.1 hypothetical protein 357Saur119PP_00056 [Staphylococcus phage 357Saur119PP]WOZ17656.1 hypothetical protein [Staphylococcus phage vB_SauM-V1SA15]WPH67087.1 hypothetical protein CUBB_gp171 [Staphyloc
MNKGEFIMDKTLPKFSVYEVIVKTVIMTPTEGSSDLESFYFSTRELAERFVEENTVETKNGKRVSFAVKERKVNQPG